MKPLLGKCIIQVAMKSTGGCEAESDGEILSREKGGDAASEAGRYSTSFGLAGSAHTCQ